MSRVCHIRHSWYGSRGRCNYYESDFRERAGGACMFSSVPRGHCCYGIGSATTNVTMEKVVKVVRNADKLKALKADIRMIRDD